MRGLAGFVARAWAHRKLRKGKCLWCGAILPDDATARYCGPECKEELDFLEAPIL